MSYSTQNKQTSFIETDQDDASAFKNTFDTHNLMRFSSKNNFNLIGDEDLQKIKNDSKINLKMQTQYYAKPSDHLSLDSVKMYSDKKEDPFVSFLHNLGTASRKASKISREKNKLIRNLKNSKK